MRFTCILIDHALAESYLTHCLMRLLFTSFNSCMKWVFWSHWWSTYRIEMACSIEMIFFWLTRLFQSIHGPGTELAWGFSNLMVNVMLCERETPSPRHQNVREVEGTKCLIITGKCFQNVYNNDIRSLVKSGFMFCNSNLHHLWFSSKEAPWSIWPFKFW